MNKKRKLYFLFGTCSFIALLSIAFALVFSHDFFLWRIKSSLLGMEHPAHSKRVATAQDLGLLVGNSNHCDCFVAEMRSYSGDLTVSKLSAFYENRVILNPLHAKHQRVSLGFIRNGRIAIKSTDDDWTGTSNFLKDRFKEFLPQKQANQRFYFV